MISKQNVIVGGGIAGICTALFLAKKGEEVVIIEKDLRCGLLRSIHPFNDKFHFDFCTHFLGQTGYETLDKLLYGNLEVKELITQRFDHSIRKFLRETVH